MRILVTGGAGFIGSHLALQLKLAGHRVRTLDNFDAYYDPSLKHQNARLLEKEGILNHRLDLALDPLEGVLGETEFVIHAAAQPGNDANTSYFSYIKNNFHSTVSLIETLKNFKINGREIPMIFVSTSSVYGLNATGGEETLPAPVSPYGVTKVAAEAAVMSAIRRKEFSGCILRYFSVYGPRERPDKLFPKLFHALKHEEEFPLFEGSREHRRSFTYVGDIVRGTILALENWNKAQGEIFNIGDHRTHTTGEALELAQEISGKRLKFQHLPARAGDQQSTAANISKARNILGYEPQITLEEGLKKVWESIQG
jgi:nucleoside-diphosphate-sugar epimerase